MWWPRLGIRHQRIQPASPQQNGAHEWMHKMLEAEATRPPAEGNVAAQQRRFRAFRTAFNTKRQHGALGGEPLATRHPLGPTRTGSPRSSTRGTSS